MNITLFETINSSTLSRIQYLTENAHDDITVQVNSSGGEVFSALSIFNLLKPKAVTVEILGLCASAATIIAMAGAKVKMAANALMMFHAPKTLLIDYYDKKNLDKLSTTLEKVEESILQAYQGRVPNFVMPEDDLWLSAQEAKSLGFVDEIIDEVPIIKDSAQVFINSIGYDIGKVKGLGERLHPTPNTTDLAKQIASLIRDQMTSGAAGVTDCPAPTEAEIKKAKAQKMVTFANGLT